MVVFVADFEYYGSKIVNLLQDNEIKESSPNLKMLKPESFRGLRSLDPRQGLCPWTPPRALRRAPEPHPWVLALRARWAPLKHFTPGATSTTYVTAPPVQAGAHNQSYNIFFHGGKKTSLIFPSYSQFCNVRGQVRLWQYGLVIQKTIPSPHWPNPSHLDFKVVWIQVQIKESA